MSFLKTLIIPSPYHKRRSVLLQPKAFVGYFFFLLLLIYLSYQITTAMPTVLGYADNITISGLLSATNRMRSDRGISTLKLNSELSRAAEMKAQDMFEKDYWAHESPDGKEPWDFIVASGYDYLYAGENLAVDFNDSENVVNAWYESPSHRENLLNSKYSEIGFAVADGELEGRKTTLVVQMFGYPRTHTAAITPEAADTEENAEIVPVPVQEIADVEVLETAPQNAELETAVEETIPPVRGSVLNSADVFNVSRFIALLLGLFLTALFVIDGYYVRKMGIFRISGHTLLHVLMLLAAIAGIWYTQVGLVL